MNPEGERVHLILYDGVCGLCNRLNRFVLARDRRRVFHFASIQGEPGGRILREMGRDPDPLTTSYVIRDYTGRSPELLTRSSGILFVLEQLGRPWSMAGALRLLPSAILDRCYDFVARNRYRVFGRLDACRAPRPEHRDRFLDSAP